MKFLKIFVLAIIGGVIVFYAARIVIAQSATPLPAWVQPNGQTDWSQFPNCAPILGADGKVSKDAKGNIRCIPKSEFMNTPLPPPTNTAEELAQPSVESETIEVTPVRP